MLGLLASEQSILSQFGSRNFSLKYLRHARSAAAVVWIFRSPTIEISNDASIDNYGQSVSVPMKQ